jgi:uncharacterized protein YcbK (DUF882 family)
MGIMIKKYFSKSLILTLFILSTAGAIQNIPIDQTSDQTEFVKKPQKISKNLKKIKKTQKKMHKKRHKYKKRCSRYVSPQYKKMKRRWQKVPKIPKPKWRNGYRDLTFYAVNLGKRVRIFPWLPNGELDPEALVKISEIMADKHTFATHPVAPRLVKLLYKLAVRFKARQITVISGYREPHDSQGHESHHANGSAMDFMIPGVRLATVAKVARRFGHVGVGFYPSSGFVHMDVRENVSFFWVDPSGPVS